MSADGSDIIFNTRGAMEPADFSLGDYWNEIKPLETWELRRCMALNCVRSAN